MAVDRRVLLRFVLLYSALFAGFGATSPFLPAFLAERGLGAEELGIVLGAATAVRLVCGPIAGRVADRFQLFRAELAVFAIAAAGAPFETDELELNRCSSAGLRMTAFSRHL